MKALSAFFLLCSLAVLPSAFADSFPTMPDQHMTPGALCQNPDSHRYPENIAYCNRNVTSETKHQIIENYDRAFGYTIEQMPREDFKIDHYIPLCVGGANSIENLWPQHKTVYVITDPLEQAVCDKMAEGKLLQKDAVELIKQGKNNLDKAPGLISYVNGL